MNIVDLLESAGYMPKRKASSGGGEFACGCPFCQDGEDRFICWPNKANPDGILKGGRYLCRVCAKKGDGITFLMETKGLPFPEACKLLNVKMDDKRIMRRQPARPPKAIIAEDPPELWQSKAKLFAEWCNTKLIKNETLLSALRKERGLLPETIERFKIGHNPETLFRDRPEWGMKPELNEETGKPKRVWLPAGVIIPAVSGENVVKLKVRRTDWKEGDKYPKYVEVSGSKKAPAIFGDRSRETLVIVESELDGVLIQQEAGDLCFCLALGGSTKPLDSEAESLVKGAKIVLFCPDFDKPGATAWAKWKKVYPHSERLLTPRGKDPTEAFLDGVDLKQWIINQR